MEIQVDQGKIFFDLKEKQVLLPTLLGLLQEVSDLMEMNVGPLT